MFLSFTPDRLKDLEIDQESVFLTINPEELYIYIIYTYIYIYTHTHIHTHVFDTCK